MSGIPIHAHLHVENPAQAKTLREFPLQLLAAFATGISGATKSGCIHNGQVLVWLTHPSCSSSRNSASAKSAAAIAGNWPRVLTSILFGWTF
jgi:hypothetical protein